MHERKVFTVRMSSAVYGTEDFHYDTLDEARAGKARLKDAAKKLDDGVDRSFEIIVIEVSASEDDDEDD